MKNKELILRFLTYFRIVCTPVILLFGIFNLNLLMLISIIFFGLTIIISIILNNIWKISSNIMNKLNLLADKIFVLGISIFLLFKYNIFICILILELFISIINIYFYYKKHKMYISNLGKYKLFAFIVSLILIVSNIYIPLNKGFCYITINLQLLSIINYIIYFIDYSKPSINDNNMHREIMDLDKTIEIDNISKLEKIYDYESE